jgi:hypothetical protein
MCTLANHLFPYSSVNKEAMPSGLKLSELSPHSTLGKRVKDEPQKATEGKEELG